MLPRSILGWITAVNATANGVAQVIVSQHSYRADGLLTGKTFGNGLGENRGYDQLGRLAA